MSLVLKVLVALSVLGIPTLAQPPQTKADYQRQLLQIQERSQKAREQIAIVQAEIQEKKRALQSGIERIEDVHNKKYALLQVSEQNVVDVKNKVAALDRFLSKLLLQPDSVLIEKAAAFSDAETMMSSLRMQPIARLRVVALPLERLGSLVEETRNRMHLAYRASELSNTANNLPLEATSPWLKVTTFTVRNVMAERESLSSIAQLVYGDAAQWPKIYSANKALIDQNCKSIPSVVDKSFFSAPPDLILPGQVLTIPR